MGPIVLAAGGTGGHMVPAHVLAGELIARGRRVVLFSDERGLRLPGLFEGVERHALASGSPSRGGLPATLAGIARGVWTARGLLARLRAAVVVGFGGYPSLPALVAAVAMRLPTVIHEQNAVLGRVNRRLAPYVDAIGTSYPRVARLAEGLAGKVRMVGNPVRAEIAAIGAVPAHERLDVLVLGGSQGASVFARVVPAALATLGQAVAVTQQARAADLDNVRVAYATAGVQAEVAPYFEDVPTRLANADLVITRAGASTIAELTAAGRASILVPLPSAMDDHQTANAAALVHAGGALMIAERDFTAERLTAALSQLTPARLDAMALAARAAGRPDAAARLADLVLETL